MKFNNLLVANSLRKFFVQQQHSLAFDHHQQQQQHQLFNDLDFNPATCHTNKSNQTFKYDELLICKSISKLSRNHNVSNKLIKLTPNSIYRNHTLSIFHEHIIERSCQNCSSSVSFNLLDSEHVTFNRPTLYEYTTLKEQLAVSSHYSIISLVPMLLEIGRHSRVLEAGTGSGSMTLFLSECLGDTGLLHTFDIHERKVTNAKKYFQAWKSSFDLSAGSQKWPSNVKFGLKDLCTEELGPEYYEFYDAIYLDMGNLDKAVLNAYKLLKVNGVLVMNALHLTQAMRVLNTIKDHGLELKHELIIEPANRLWEIKKIRKGAKSDLAMDTDYESLDWTCRLEDRFDEKFKRGGMFFNYWSGFLVKLRKVKSNDI